MDWDDAYANAAHISGAEAYPPRWQAQAAAFRATTPHDALSYGGHGREQMDLFFPADDPKGLVVFVHGGYWLRFDNSYWSHLAAGPLAHGYAVAMPSYPLAPEATIPQITQSVARAMQMAADAVPGPIRLTGHSAGGHLAARMLCADVDLPCRDRIAKALPISPVADLRPLRHTQMAGPLHLDGPTCDAHSPVLSPRPAVPCEVWVGADERPVFLEQAADLGRAWGCAVQAVRGKHHFDIIDELADPRGAMCQALLA